MQPIEYWNEDGEFILVAKDGSYRVRVRLLEGMAATLDYLKPRLEIHDGDCNIPFCDALHEIDLSKILLRCDL